jgi:peptide/nickel transport system permease protein
MRRYLGRRVLQSIGTILIVAMAIFFAINVLGDPVALMLEEDYTPQQYEALKERLGYDRPLLTRFGDYMLGFVRADFGESMRQHRPAFEIVMERVPKTLYLGGVAFTFALMGIPLGILAAKRPRSALDQVINTGAFAAMAAPNFWVALMGIQVFAVQLGWLPTSGFSGFGFDSLPYLVLPAGVLCLGSISRFSQFTRTAVMEELAQQYVQTARAKGLANRVVLRVHVMKNAGIAIATLAGDEIAHIVNGSVIIETVFGWPGIGNLMITSIQQRDVPLVMATVIVVLTIVMTVNFTVDMIYARLDPRVRYT